MSKEIQINFEVPDRESDEEDITDKQRAFIGQLFRKIGMAQDALAIDELGKFQASALIDQLIEIRDAGGQVVSVNAPRKERPSFLLIIGIVFLPYIFAWFTLRPNFSNLTRIISFAWAASIVYLAIGNRL